jgi:DNA-binding protein Fis
MKVLYTWVGAHDPWWRPPGSPPGTRIEGPILSLLAERRFDRVYLLCTPTEQYPEQATKLLRVAQRRWPHTEFTQRPVDLASPVAYVELYRTMNDVLRRIAKEDGLAQRDTDASVFLSPGTPQMQLTWILLVQSRLLKARMLEVTPPQYRIPGVPAAREVKLDLTDYPRVLSPRQAQRELGVIQERSRNLELENAALRGQIATLRQRGQHAIDSLSAGFNLDEHLLTVERGLYAHAFREASGDATRAARLLGISSHRFRKRAEQLGIRARRGKNGADSSPPRMPARRPKSRKT